MKEIDVMIRPDPLNEKFEAKISCVFARLRQGEMWTVFYYHLKIPRIFCRLI